MVQSRLEKLLQGLKKISVIDPSAKLTSDTVGLHIHLKEVNIPLINYLAPLGFVFDEKTRLLVFKVNA